MSTHFIQDTKGVLWSLRHVQKIEPMDADTARMTCIDGSTTLVPARVYTRFQYHPPGDPAATFAAYAKAERMSA